MPEINWQLDLLRHASNKLGIIHSNMFNHTKRVTTKRLYILWPISIHFLATQSHVSLHLNIDVQVLCYITSARLVAATKMKVFI